MRTISIKHFGILACTFILLSCFEQKKEQKSESTVTVTESTQVKTDDTIPKEELQRIKSYEAFCNSLKLGDQVEYLNIEWPGDDRLCDSYDGSNGALFYSICRLVKTKQIISISDWGSYCQGDSEFGSYFYFDSNGKAIFSSVGHNEYVDEAVHFYSNGIPIVEVVHPSAYGDLKIRTVRPAQPKETITTHPFVARIGELLVTMQDRINALEAIVFDAESTETREEARNTINELQANLFPLDSIESQYVQSAIIGFPIEEGSLNLKSINVSVKNKPSISASTVGYVSYYNNYLRVEKIGKKEKIDGLGTFHWYKIKYQNAKREYCEGWIFGSEVMLWTY